MTEKSDRQLLRAYSERRSDAAFSELVRRHLDFVHSSAVRIVGDADLAKDVSQGVFVALARNASKLAKHPVLSGWLHRTTRNIAAQTVRTEVRRRNREREATIMIEDARPDPDEAWLEIAPQLDGALSELSEPDCDAVLLRYFENKPAKEMAQVLGISAEAAQKRVTRAVDRLRKVLTKRGIGVGAVGLAGVLSSHAVQSAPSGLAAGVSSSALSGATSSASLASATGGGITAKILAMNTTQKVVGLAAIAVFVGVGLYAIGEALSPLKASPTSSTPPPPRAKPAGPPAAKSGQRSRDSIAERLSQARTNEKLTNLQQELASLKERWKELKPGGNSVIKEKDALARVSCDLLLCTEEGIALMAWLEGEEMRYGALKMRTMLERMLRGERAPELRKMLMALPSRPAGTLKATEGIIQNLCNAAGEHCPPDEFEAFYRGLQSNTYAQEARLGYNCTLMLTDPNAAVLSILEILESDLHTRSKHDTINRMFREELPNGTDFAGLLDLLPAGDRTLSDSTLDWTPIQSGRNSLFRCWAKADFQPAAAHLAQHRDRYPPRLFRTIAMAHKFESAQAALAWVHTIAEGPCFDQAAIGILYTLMGQSPDEGRRLASNIRDPKLQKKAQEIIDEMTRRAAVGR